jgi:hypothetical protein
MPLPRHLLSGGEEMARDKSTRDWLRVSSPNLREGCPSGIIPETGGEERRREENRRKGIEWGLIPLWGYEAHIANGNI